MFRRRVLLLLLSVILVVGTFFWVWLIAPWLTRLPANFSYRADLISLDNFYDEAKQAFSGEKRSVTKFSYEVAEQNQGDFVVRNIFDVRTVTGEKIFAVERLYGVDPKTGHHVAGLGDHDREGYLFAPRMKGFLRQAQDKEPFTYWHINYDGPAHMAFVGEENLLGLPVYRYETHYEGVRIDQTKNLSDLPGVGVTRGIEVEPYLQLWVEPTSGHLVKYKDDTIAYYYDLKTGQRLDPWNHFSNTYTPESVKNQVELAKQEKRTINIVEFIIPALFVLLAVCSILLYYRKHKGIVFSVSAALVVGTLAFALAYIHPLANVYTGPVEKIRIGIEHGPLSVPILIADSNGYFKTEGIDLAITEFSAGRLALEALLKDNKVDIATVAQTPIVLNSFSRDDFQVIAGMISSENDVKIIARKDRGVASATDLKGKKIGVTKGTTGNYFLGLFLANHGLSLQDVEIADTDASNIADAIISGEVDAVASWEPHIYHAQTGLDNNALLLQSQGVFREDFYLTALQRWAQQNPDLLIRFLRAVNKAENFIKEYPVEAQQTLVARLGIDPTFLASIWPDFSFKLFLDQSVLLTFEQQARWAKNNQLVPALTTPEFLKYIYFDALESVKPEAVTIIR